MRACVHACVRVYFTCSHLLRFFPDVGGSYFLPRLPGSLGMFLALTGSYIMHFVLVLYRIQHTYTVAKPVPILFSSLLSTSTCTCPMCRLGAYSIQSRLWCSHMWAKKRCPQQVSNPGPQERCGFTVDEVCTTPRHSRHCGQ